VCLWGNIICLCSVGIQRGWKDCFSVECTVNVNHRWCLTGVSEACRTAIATRGWLGYLFTYETYACHWQGEIWTLSYLCELLDHLKTGLCVHNWTFMCGVCRHHCILYYCIGVCFWHCQNLKSYIKKGLVIIKPWWEKFHLFVSQNWSDSIPV